MLHLCSALDVSHTRFLSIDRRPFPLPVVGVAGVAAGAVEAAVATVDRPTVRPGLALPLVPALIPVHQTRLGPDLDLHPRTAGTGTGAEAEVETGVKTRIRIQVTAERMCAGIVIGRGALKQVEMDMMGTRIFHWNRHVAAHSGEATAEV